MVNLAVFCFCHRYQRLVPGRENIAAEHLVPQIGYVATSKALIWLNVQITVPNCEGFPSSLVWNI